MKQVSENDSVVAVSVTDTLDNSIYNLPLSIRRVLPKDWSSATVTQNGKTIKSVIVDIDSVKYISFDVVPDSGEIKLVKEKITGVMGSIKTPGYNPSLLQSYPNPFNPVTTISYQIPEKKLVTLKVYDSVGRKIATLVDDILLPGKYSVEFNGSNLSSGLYFTQLSFGNYSTTKKLVLLK